MPSRRSGIATAKPSGQFCKPSRVGCVGDRTKRHADRQTFRDVVECDRQDQQNTSAPRRAYPLGLGNLLPEMQVRQCPIDGE
jgi:hypothetical protein